jgi:hypothetical protein
MGLDQASAYGGENAKLLGPEHDAGFQHRIAPPHFPTFGQDILPRLESSIFDPNAVLVVSPGPFDHNHRVSSGGDRRSCHNPRGLPRAQRQAWRLAGRNFLDPGQESPALRQVHGPDRVPVHERLVIGRHVEIADNVLGQDQSQRGMEGDGLWRQGTNLPQHQGLSFRNAEHPQSLLVNL